MTKRFRAQPAVLLRAASEAGTDPTTLPAAQLLVVSCRGSAAELRCYEKKAVGLWHRAGLRLSKAAHIGRNGAVRLKREGDGCTPVGFFPLGHAFGCREKPQTAMPYRLITSRSVWVDDPASTHYNTWAEDSDERDWSSAERLSGYPDSYAYAVVIEYNTVDITPGKGSAIFLHCGSLPTTGCVAVSEAALLDILSWLDPAKSPGILIAGSASL